jgi:proteasome assembly chaperone (PAC2) family protein
MKVYKETKMDDFIVFASLPDIGQVGGLVTKHLITELKADKIADIRIFEKPWVKIQEGLVAPIVDKFEIFSSKDHRIIIFSGSEQPQDPNNLLNLCSTLISFINTIGIPRQIYTAGGYHRPQLSGNPRVFAASTDKNIILNFKEKGIEILDKEIEIITWFNGLIMAISKEMGLRATGLFSEISETNKPSPLAAKSIVDLFSKLEGIRINTDKFDEDHESQIQESKRKIGPVEPFKKNINPGIG